MKVRFTKASIRRYLQRIIPEDFYILPEEFEALVDIIHNGDMTSEDAYLCMQFMSKRFLQDMETFGMECEERPTLALVN